MTKLSDFEQRIEINSLANKDDIVIKTVGEFSYGLFIRKQTPHRTIYWLGSLRNLNPDICNIAGNVYMKFETEEAAQKFKDDHWEEWIENKTAILTLLSI